MFDAAGVATAAFVADDAAASLRAADHAPSGDANGQPDAVAQDVGPFGSKAEAQLAAADGVFQARNEIVFVDARLPDLGRLTAADGVEIIILDPTLDGVAQVSAALAGRHNIDAVHFVGHGEGGQFSLGASTIDAAEIDARASEIAGWSSALSADADLMIWGCDVGSTAAGHALMGSLSQITGADVAASVDSTGAEALGGDWRLEVSTGAIETAQPFAAEGLASWGYLLAAPKITGTTDLRVAEPSDLNAHFQSSSSIRLGEANWGLTYDVDDAADQVRITVGGVADTFGAFTEGVTGGTKGDDGSWTFEGTMADANIWLQSLTFTAADVELGNTNASAAITVTVENQTDGGTASRALSLRVTASNDPTILPDASLQVDEIQADGSPSVTVIDGSVFAPIDPEVEIGAQSPEQIVYTLKTNTEYGYLTLDGVRIGAGSVFTQKDVIGGLLAYVHTAKGADQNTTDSFVVIANDGATPMSASDEATISLNIKPVNQAPVVSGGGQVFEGQPKNAVSPGVTPSIVGNFISADGGGDPNDPTLVVKITALPTSGWLYFDGELVSVGFEFAYADRARLTYAHDGIDDSATQRPASTDSFEVEVTDGGGGAGEAAKLSASATIDLTVLAVNDDPVWDPDSTLQADVDDGSYRVTLDASMLNVTDVDSTDNSLSFVIAAHALDQGRLILTTPGRETRVLPVGGTFSLADVREGRVEYIQYAGAQAGDTDSFSFYVVDNGVTLGWQPDGTHFERPGGVYDDPADPHSQLKTFDFTINLAQTATGEGGAMPDFSVFEPAGSSSNYAGANEAGVAIGELVEDGTVVLYNGKDDEGAARPGLSYEVPGIAPNQIVYTIMGFEGAGENWNGKLQALRNDVWVDLHLYDRFTQANLDAGMVRFAHDGGEDFESSVKLSASAGVLVPGAEPGTLVPDEWVTDFSFYVTPLNDRPTAVGSADNVLDEGAWLAITTDILRIGDPDDANSETWLENAATLPGGEPNYALNHDAAAPLTFTISDLPDHGVLQWNDGGGWQAVTADTVLQASWLTGDPSTTGLRYFHRGGENLADGFSAVATDRHNATSEVASVAFVITPVNDAPDIAQTPALPDPEGIIPGGGAGTAVNNPLDIVKEGAWAQITPDFLQAIDPDSSATQVQYSITAAPDHGRLAYSTDGGVSFTTLGVGSSFSQDDIAKGYIYYQHGGDEPSGRTFAAEEAPDDKFKFTLSDGASEVADREFWIYVRPSNDAPVVTAPAGPIDSTDTAHGVPGFRVGDPDLDDSLLPTEKDFLQVTVRLLDAAGQPLDERDYSGITLGIDAGSGVTVDTVNDGSGKILVLRGTQAQINTALAGLNVIFPDDRNKVYQVEVIADDRVRDLNSGGFEDRDTVTPEDVNVGGNGGGTFNQSPEPYTKDALPVSDYDGFNWYLDAVPADNAAIVAGYPADIRNDIVSLIGNFSSATVVIRASSTNDPAVLTGETTVTTNEDQYSPIGSQIQFVISDAESLAFGTSVTVTLSVPAGALQVGAPPAGILVTGNETGNLTVSGTANAIQTFLNASLAYRSAADANHDQNGDAAAGDITLTVSFDDTESAIGSSGDPANPPDLEIAITIVPLNDAPTVSAGSGVLVIVGETPVDGITITDKDILGDIAGNPADEVDLATDETDFVQVTVRVRTAGGILDPEAHESVKFGSTTTVTEGLTFKIDGTYHGDGSALVIRGTLAQVQAYLAGLTVEFTAEFANADQSHFIDIIVDDRVRDLATGALASPAAGNGGANPQGTTTTQPAPTTAVLPYAAVPGGLSLNVAVASRQIFVSAVNDPAHIDVVHTPASEGNGTVQLHGITITDQDALSTDVLQATVQIGGGLEIASFSLAEGAASVSQGIGSLTITGTLAQINATINSIVVALPDAPGDATASDWNGSFSVRIIVNDLGNNGGRPTSLPGDTNTETTNPGDFAYVDPTQLDEDPSNDNHLLTTREFTFVVNPVNDAPRAIEVNGSRTVTLSGVEDAGVDAAPSSVSVLFAAYFDDARDLVPGGADSDSFIGVAVVNLALNPAQGEWQYLNGGVWTAIGARTAATALYLAADAQIRFVPATDFHGSPNKLDVRLVENDAGEDASSQTNPETGNVINLSGVSAVGGESRFSAETVTLVTSVANVNDRPTLGNSTLVSVQEDNKTPPGATVSALFGAQYGDATDNQTSIIGGANAATPFGGIAIVSNPSAAAEGVWQYSNNGTSWSDVPANLSDLNALVLGPTAMLRFLPAENFNGTPSGLDVRASDTPVVNGTGVDISDSLGATSNWSDVAKLNTVVTPLNDAPTLAGTALNPAVTENGDTGTGISIPDTLLFEAGSVSVADLDLSTTPGLVAGVFGAGEIEITLGSTYLAGDRLSLALDVGLMPAGVSIDPANDGSSGKLIVKLGPNTTIAEMQALIEALTYSSSSDNPTDFGGNTSRTYTLVIRDGNNRDAGGDTAGGPVSLASAPLVGEITIAAVNDPPVAENNVKTIAEDTASVSGNVIFDPAPGGALDRDPDTRVADLVISDIAFGATPGDLGTALNGAYGALTLNADGSYSYALDNSNRAVNALKDNATLTEVFTYTLSDGSASDTATLTITIAGRTDGAPVITPVDGNGAADGHNTVYETGLGKSGDDSEFVTGSITVAAADGLTSVEIGDIILTTQQLADLDTKPVVITTDKGRITITGFEPSGDVGGVPTGGELSYSYELTSAQNHSGGAVTDVIALKVNDAGGSQSTGNLTIDIVDDQPVASDDVASVDEDAPAPVTGNVITTGPGADVPGADGAMVTAVTFGGATVDLEVPFDASYGALTINPDGSYSYALDNNNARVNALKDGETLTEVFSYVITDSDGDTATATLTITINGKTDGALAITPVDGNGSADGQNTVHEGGLGDGGDDREITSGTIDITAGDGLTSLQIGGETITPGQLADLDNNPVVIITDKGKITITGIVPAPDVGGLWTGGQITYSYELTSPQGHSGGAVTDVISLTVNDAGGGQSTGELTILIEDDVPVATNDTASITEDAAGPVTGNVFSGAGAGDVADAIGGDGASATGPVTGVAFDGTDGVLGAGVPGKFGTLTLNPDGSYSYDLDNTNPDVNALKDGQTLTDIFSYQIEDADGDISIATLTITINGTTDAAPVITPVDGNGAADGHNTVYETGLGKSGDDSEFVTGSITVAAADGLTSVEIGGITLTTQQLADLDSNPVVITTDKGKITLSGFQPSGDVGGVLTGGKLSYTYELTSAQDHSGGAVTDVIALKVNDAGGSQSTGNLTIDIVDDQPVASDDVASVDEDAPAPVTGNVITTGPGADVPGADGAVVTAVTFGGATVSLRVPFDASYGALTINPDGSYSYALDNDNPRVNALKDGETLTEVFSYEITDADGDTATATLTITVTGRTDGALVITPADRNGGADGHNTVHEAGLNDSDDPRELTTGAITITSGDGLTSVEIGGVILTVPELAELDKKPFVITTDKGRITITGFKPSGDVGGVPTAGELTYTYELTSPQDHAAGPVSDVISLTVNDAGGGQSTGELTILVENDVPVATDDVAAIIKGDNGTKTTTQGNVFTGSDTGAGADRIGRDGAANGTPLSSAQFGDRAIILGEAFDTAYGVLTLNADGSYSYELDNSHPRISALPAGEALTEVVTYTITDADGDISVATLTIVINGRNEGSANMDAVVGSLGTPWPAFRGIEWGGPSYLEGRPLHVYTAAWQTVSQQALFRQTGNGLPGSLTYDAALGRSQALPSWITFEASTQTVTARPGDDVQPGIYVVRVVARDADGNEAESSVTFHVLRSLEKSLDLVRGDDAGAADGQDRGKNRDDHEDSGGSKGHAPPPASGEVDDDAGAADDQPPAGEPSGARSQLDGHAPRQQHGRTDSSVAPVMGTNASLTRALIRTGAAGQLIEAARFLEALASIDQPNS